MSENLKVVVVDSLSAYIDVVSAINSAENDTAWFRGHSSATYRLTPGALRDLVAFRDAYGRPLDGTEVLRASGYELTGVSPERMLSDFKRRSIPFLDFVPRNDFEWLFLMQHHGVPTRLLDWTTNALVALYFAIEDSQSSGVASDEDREEEIDEFAKNAAAVFAMNPHKVNHAMHADIDEVVDVAADYGYWEAYTRPTMLSSEHFDNYAPLCITAPQLSPRIRAQSGLFTIHGRDVNPLDWFSAVRPLITKILIPQEKTPIIWQQLRHFGFTKSFIYPGLDSVAHDVRFDEQRRWGHERKAYLEKLERERSSKEKRAKKKRDARKKSTAATRGGKMTREKKN
ncbi:MULTISPECIES: FRG domain-containing protein [Burkholderia]|uniref:FRG domain-containing protein n=2 Tax=Burkholderia cepacia complex TaxID=87882 RepID=A0A2S5DZM8_9BURK|nr:MULTISPECIES: FRG domain-containing protein [Burkholderia]EKS9796300.1 FRG domain-containing protein [Burkholderia cepacia]EKS9802934.1 FRG domain-containing protein [Burkholderia cepacia]EKS9810418.1 FRG domain-containing protein [Burkholderia cepacia]EKS9817583.1 FRG domain-containing protein [Burkholderia cepacia]EKS9824516.1 FRG domain-containing protein [Burkholderia cepacia]